jgi:hypothetical protein
MYIFACHLAITVRVVVGYRQRLMVSAKIGCALFAKGASVPLAGRCLGNATHVRGGVVCIYACLRHIHIVYVAAMLVRVPGTSAYHVAGDQAVLV